MALWKRVHYKCRNTKCGKTDSDTVLADSPFFPTLNCYSCHSKDSMQVTGQDEPYESAGAAGPEPEVAANFAEDGAVSDHA